MEQKGIPNNDQSHIYNQITIKADEHSSKHYIYHTDVKNNQNSKTLVYNQIYYPDSEEDQMPPVSTLNALGEPQDIEAETPIAKH